MATDLLLDVDGKKFSSREFSEQIRQLELEGARLQEATRNLGESLGGLSLLSPPRSQRPEPSTSRNLLSFSPFGDNHADELSSDLDLYTVPLPPELNMKLNMPRVSSSGDTALLPVTPSYADRQLQESRAEAASLQNRLHETMAHLEQRKEQYRINVEDLRRRLQEAEIARENAVQKWRQESAGHEALAVKLQEAISQLDKANRIQEESLFQYNEKLDVLQREQSVTSAAIGQLHATLAQRETKRGAPYYDSEPVSKQTVAMLVHTVERCLQELEAELMMKTAKCQELKSELDTVQGSHGERLGGVERQYEEKLSQARREHSAELAAVTEQLSQLRRQHTSAEDQLLALRREMESQVTRKDGIIKELEDQLRVVKADYNDKWTEWKHKREAMELAMDNMEKEAVTVRAERDDAIRKCAAVESRFSHMQQVQVALEAELEVERGRGAKLAEREREVKRNEERTSDELRSKTLMVEHLEKLLNTVRQEMQQQLQQTVSQVQKEGEGKMSNELSRLTLQCDTMTDKCQRLSVELEVMRAENQGLREKAALLSDTTDKLARQLEAEIQKKENLNTVLTDRLTDVDQLSREHARCCEMLVSRESELSALQLTCERLQVQLEEREKNFLMLREQGERVAAMAEASREESERLREDRDQLTRRLEERTSHWDEVKKAKDEAARQLRSREKKLRDAEETGARLAGETEALRDRLAAVLEERDLLLAELKQSRYEVACQTSDINALRTQAADRAQVHQRDVEVLQQRLTVVERELTLAQQMLRMKDDISGKVVKAAGKMQKEVTEKRSEIDTVMGQIRMLEEKLEAANRGNALLRGDNEKLSYAVRQAAENNDKMADQLKVERMTNRDLLDKITDLEQSIHKAGAQKAHVDCQVEQYEQDIARLKLKYQLQMKETERSSTNKLAPECAAVVAKYSPRVTRPASDMDELPVSQKPVKSRSQTADVPQTDEAKKLLLEMKSMLQGHLTHCQQGAVETPRDTDKTTVSESDSGVERHTGNRSPVARLLVQSDDSSSSAAVPHSTSTGLRHHRRHKKPGEKSSAASETTELCRRLEKKICNLNSLGSKLKMENQGMAAVMKAQEKKLSHISTQLK